MASERETLVRMYDAFNARDADAVLAEMTPDVEWPNGWEGGMVRGQDAVREYWTRQWAAIVPRVVPETFTPLPDNRLRLEVDQTIRDHDGNLLSDGGLTSHKVVHTYTFRDGLIARMEIG